jgi:hypothetical protein
MIYRYVLHLESDSARRTIRWMFAHPVAAGEAIELPTFGRWYVARAVSEPETAGSGVLYCTPLD